MPRLRSRSRDGRVARMQPPGWRGGSPGPLGRQDDCRGSASRERNHGVGDHPIPFRTRQLSPTSPKVLRRQAAGGQVVPLAGGAFLRSGRPGGTAGPADAAAPTGARPCPSPCSGLGAARRPLGPEAGRFRAPAGPSPTSSGEPVRQNYIIIWTPMRASFCFCAPLTVKWERLLSLKI